jgi:sugar/nucleoside kinase (ribokinase family)
VEAFAARDVDLTGLVRAPGRSFHWAGRYIGDMNVRETIRTDLEVTEGWEPAVPEAFRDSELVFLANGHPEIQAATLDQIRKPCFVLLDTMNLWIDTAREALDGLLRRVDGIVVNDEEARMLTGKHNLVEAGRALLRLGPRVVILKKGEHGAFLLSGVGFFALPAYPVTDLVDPTGAGDSFAGGFMGSLAEAGRLSFRTLREAMVDGTVMASFAVEAFGTERLEAQGRGDEAPFEFARRYDDMREFTQLD